MIDLKEVSIAWFRSFNPTPEQKETEFKKLLTKWEEDERRDNA